MIHCFPNQGSISFFFRVVRALRGEQIMTLNARDSRAVINYSAHDDLPA